MATDTTVKFIHSAMLGAPVLSGTAGAMLALLDACLVNGFGAGTADSVTIAAGVATVTRAAGHSFEVGSVALIAGATITGGSINGEQRVLAATATTYTFDATGLSNQTATGTITHKVAPLNWAKTFTGTNLAAYKPTDVAATGCLLRIDDTGTTNTRALGYESMSDINTGTGPFPTTAQVSGGLFWPKSDVANTTARSWVLIGDGRIFYLAVAYHSSYPITYGIASSFGDLIPIKTPDAYSCHVYGPSASVVSGQPGSSSGSELMYSYAGSLSGSLFSPRSFTGLGGAISAAKASPILAGSNTGVFSGATGFPYPNPTDGGLYLSPMYMLESNQALRGQFPGAYFVNQAVGTSGFATRDIAAAVAGLPGRTLRAINNASGVSFIDATGPWR